jgi:hypothetical protein|tara:strand:+ start:858 stop:1133 length:276 start_codon:yes stop_codon:yes gene_type:complete
MQRRKYKKHKRPGSTGSKHWNWRHGRCSMETRKEQADTVCTLRYLCDIGTQGRFMSPTTKFMGRPPDDYLSLDLSKTENLVYALLKINKLI